MMYELRPDLFPQAYLTPLEIQLWELFFEELNEQGS